MCDSSLYLPPSPKTFYLFPFLPLSPLFLSDIDGVLRRANATDYGLASGIFTRDINKVKFFFKHNSYCNHLVIFSHVLQALRVSDDLQAGTVFINTYNKTDVAALFGGFKQSGFGKDVG